MGLFDTSTCYLALSKTLNTNLIDKHKFKD